MTCTWPPRIVLLPVATGLLLVHSPVTSKNSAQHSIQTQRTIRSYYNVLKVQHFLYSFDKQEPLKKNLPFPFPSNEIFPSVQHIDSVDRAVLCCGIVLIGLCCVVG